MKYSNHNIEQLLSILSPNSPFYCADTEKKYWVETFGFKFEIIEFRRGQWKWTGYVLQFNPVFVASLTKTHKLTQVESAPSKSRKNDINQMATNV